MADIKINNLPNKSSTVGTDKVVMTDTENANLSKNITMDVVKTYVNFIENEITVAKSGADFTTIKEALDSITDNSVTQRYVVLVSPGIYIEDNPLLGKEYVMVKSTGDLHTTRIQALNPNEDLFTMVNFFLLERFTFWGVTGVGKYAINQEVAGLTSLLRCAIAECSNGIHVNHVNADMQLSDVGVYNISTTTTRGVYLEAGIAEISRITGSLGNITTLIEATGINSILRINRLSTEISTLGTAVFLRDQVRATIASMDAGEMVDGIVIEGGSKARINSTFIHDAQNGGFRINDVGTGTDVVMQSTTIEGSIGFDVEVLSTTATLTGSGQTAMDNVNFVPGSGIYASIIDTKEDDEGINIIGELHVGVPERGSESTLGEGDSYTRGMLVYTETDSNVFVDISVNARTASGSTFTFTDKILDNSIYIGSSLESGIDKLVHYGFKSKVMTPAIYGAGNIVIEYWNGSSWIEVNGMEVDSGVEYFPHAKNYFQEAGGKHIRYSQELVQDSWTKNDPMSIGTDYYWVRLRITADLTTAPIFEQFKLHTNRFEINADGWIEYFGKARPIAKLPWEVQVFEKATGTDVKDQDLYLSKTIDNGGKKNKFLYDETDPNKVQRIGFKTTLPFDMDTSTPVDFQWSVVSDTTDGGTIDWIIRWGFNSDGDSVYTTSAAAPTTAPNEQEIILVSTPPATLNKTKWYQVSLDVSDMVSRREGGFGDTIWVSMERSSTDTHTGDASLISMGAYYTKWCEGGHI